MIEKRGSVVRGTEVKERDARHRRDSPQIVSPAQSRRLRYPLCRDSVAASMTISRVTVAAWDNIAWRCTRICACGMHGARCGAGLGCTLDWCGTQEDLPH